MDILWAHQRCTVQQVVQQLRVKRTIAYTTVATVLNRLHEKKIVTKQAEKNYHYFAPAFSRNEYSASVMQRFLNDFIALFGDAAIPSFAGGINTLKEKDRRKLIELLEANGKK